jgi:hypothetical protein
MKRSEAHLESIGAQRKKEKKYIAATIWWSTAIQGVLLAALISWTAQ